MTWPHGDPDAVVARVLADPAYASAPRTTGQKPQESLWQIVWNWLVDHVLRPLFHPVAHAFASSRGVATVAGFVLVALALCGLGYVVFRLLLAFVNAPNAKRAMRPGAATSLDAERSARDWRALARAAAARGDFAQAIAALFGAALAELDEQTLVAYDAARTPGEYRRLVRRARARAEAPFDELTERFVRALYAPEAPERAEYEAAERALAALEPALSA